MRPLLMKKLEENGVKILDRHTVISFTDSGVVAADEEGKTALLR